MSSLDIALTLVRGLRQLSALVQRLALLLLYFPPATNRYCHAAKRDRPATNQPALPPMMIDVSAMFKDISKKELKWPYTLLKGTFHFLHLVWWGDGGGIILFFLRYQPTKIAITVDRVMWYLNSILISCLYFDFLF